ncbi:alpha/beta fold hydrolase [Caulobacter sp. UNC358MFTsu5.1]|uniref:alpha/beta fold hydrolase n=1 Tax=Caulobacter sp. UNC358MFTsu5.1 TaxID=1449049 RepID=UPI00068B5731|nr:alpha/beta fold hydrolase [Caulobacter sp. UNC358MFTsu5.1]
MLKIIAAAVLMLGSATPPASSQAQARPRVQLQREYRLQGSGAPAWSPSLLVREQAPASGDRSHPVLYVHGASFPSALSIMFRFGGQSWADALNAEGYDVFGLDFAGYGGSERYPQMTGDNPVGSPLGRAPAAADQIARAVSLIQEQTGAQRVSIIAHSWGTMPAALFAQQHPERVDKLVLFGPILRRDGPTAIEPSAWFLVTNDQQHARFIKDVPTDHSPVLEEADFPAWASAYLASDPTSSERSPPSVKVPSGPSADVLDARSGRLPYDPAALSRPVMVVRGAWDSSSTRPDVERFAAELPKGLERRLVEIPQATHLAHLETGRHRLYAETSAFLAGRPPIAQAWTSSERSAPTALYAVLFEVRPEPARKARYLEIAAGLKGNLSAMPGFLENERFASQTRPGVLLSLSLWDSEKALVRWRAEAGHHQAQVEGRSGVLADYHLRVGEAVGGFGVPAVGTGDGRRDETEVGAARIVTVAEWTDGPGSTDVEAMIAAAQTAQHERFDHLSAADRHLDLAAWDDEVQARKFIEALGSPLAAAGGRAYVIRVVRDYGLTDRREAPQYHAPILH